MAASVESFLLERCGVERVEAAGDFRRRVEVVRDISFVIGTDDFPSVLSQLERFGGKTDLLNSGESSALLRLPSGIPVRVEAASEGEWGVRLIEATGSEAHVSKLGPLVSGSSEACVYRKLGLAFIPPELREGNDEVELAACGELPELVCAGDIRGELHAHTVSSDGKNTIAQMMEAARARGYEYIGISDHSRSLKIAGGLSEDDLWAQIRFIDKLNAAGRGFRVLKSAEVDILADGSLDYSDDLLKELDYTVCSIHSRFGLDKRQQTERILRAMDNRYVNVLGHATGRLLLKRPGYEIDIERVVRHARLAREAGVMLAITTDAHSIRDFDLVRYGIGQARRAGLQKESVLNALHWPELERVFRR
jgi:DNA polymerase (family 10)